MYNYFRNIVFGKDHLMNWSARSSTLVDILNLPNMRLLIEKVMKVNDVQFPEGPLQSKEDIMAIGTKSGLQLYR